MSAPDVAGRQVHGRAHMQLPHQSPAMHDRERLHVDSPGRDMQLTNKSGALSPGQRLLVRVKSKGCCGSCSITQVLENNLITKLVYP